MGDHHHECDIEEEEAADAMDWSELHEDLLEQILKKFTFVSDCLRFGSVCVSWRNTLVPHFHPDLLHPQLPLLLIPTPSTTSSSAVVIKKEEQTRSFYNVSEKRVYKDIEIKLPYNMHCRGSCHGWLIAAGFDEDTGYAVELINPLISINNNYLKIQLPPLTALPEDPNHDIIGPENLPKVVLSANPLTNPKDYVVMAIYGGCLLTYWKPGDQVWNHVPWSGGGSANIDLIHHKGLYYIVNSQANVHVCDLGSAGGTSNTIDSNHDQPHRPIKVWKIASSPIPGRPGGIEKYLVKMPSSGDLIMVHRFHTISRDDIAHPHSTEGFSVFKLLVEEKQNFTGNEEEERRIGNEEDFLPVKEEEEDEDEEEKRIGNGEDFLPGNEEEEEVEVEEEEKHTGNEEEEEEKLTGNKKEEEEEEEEEEMVDIDIYSKGIYSTKWRLMSNLENQMFFVGDNAAMSLPAHEFSGGKPNHIYFTADCIYDEDGFRDMGVLNYNGWSIEQIHPMGPIDYILPVTAIWVEPTLRCCLRF